MTRGPLVSVWPHREIAGWNGNAADLPHLEIVPAVPLLDALSGIYGTDAHFWPGYVDGPDGPEMHLPRLNKGARTAIEAAGERILFGVIVLDVDAPGHAATSTEWLDGQMAKVEALGPAWTSTMGCYVTRGGYRLLWRLPEPVGIESYLAHLESARLHLAAHGITADEFLDWGRCYRLPFVIRDKRAERRETFFDGLEAGTLALATLNAAPPSTGSGGRFSRLGKARKAGEAYKAPDQITEHRNIELVRLAGALRRAGLDPETVRLSLLQTNRTRCVPPLEDDEVERIAGNAAKWDPPEAPAPFVAAPSSPVPLQPPGDTPNPPAMPSSAPRFLFDSDVYLAQHALADLEVHGFRTAFDRGALWRYDPAVGHWRAMEGHTVRMLVAGWDGQGVQVGDKVKPLRVSARTMHDVWRVVQDARAQPHFLDGEAPGMVFQNGFVRVSPGTGEVTLEPWAAETRATQGLPYTYAPGAVPERFVAFLESCFALNAPDDVADKIQCLREFIGVCLVGRATAFQKGLILHGTGANGKSTFQRIVAELFPAAMRTAIPPQDMGQEYRRALLAGSRLNVVAELPEAEIMEGESVKAMLAGDRMTARQIREAPFEFYPRAGHLFSANALPPTRDITHGFFRRWIVLDWNREFALDEQDPTIGDEIIRTELGIIAAWALDGAGIAEARGALMVPRSAAAAVDEWRESSDQVASWLRERGAGWNGTPVDADTFTSAATLYADFRAWAERNGHARMAIIKFGKRLTALRIEKRHTRGGQEYRVALAQSDLMSSTANKVRGAAHE